MKLQHLTDKILHEDTLKFVTFERRSSVEILYHIQENDRRKLYSDYKCTSLFDYCVRILGYSEASAQRRIVATRMLMDFPDIGSKLQKGALTLTNISLIQQHFRENEINNLKEKKLILSKIENLSKKECEKKLFQISGKEKSATEEKKRISHDKNLVSLILSDTTLAEIEKLKSLLSKNLPMDELIKFMAKAAIEKVEREKFKQTEKPKAVSPAKVIGRIPVSALKREVYERDKKCVKCGSIHHLNYDHRKPWALGGETNSENIRLLCFNCNQRSRIMVFGTGPP